jgi:hypothetical protein
VFVAPQELRQYWPNLSKPSKRGQKGGTPNWSVLDTHPEIPGLATQLDHPNRSVDLLDRLSYCKHTFSGSMLRVPPQDDQQGSQNRSKMAHFRGLSPAIYGDSLIRAREKVYTSTSHTSHLMISASRHLRISGSQDLDISGSQDLRISGPLDLRIPASQHPRTSGPQHPSTPAPQYSYLTAPIG